ncbi:DUF190 domain-containing protein [Alicyclobacillus tolerans]|uniref:DUF190 domain-containing protein n=1 Tax=Alicyclobacillus tolerans TaxID=90970 RepID=UPI001F19F935|nr:DUF190 domain-containing protein [Alicyclobacillus tolerans]MCF8566373.1 DUF190 domain-containing protein [Alicyclobacillus tolerans]
MTGRWEADTAAAKIGLYNGAQTCEGGVLLYRQLLKMALDAGIRGATVWRAIEGGRSRGAFRSVESEVASNELPLWLEFVDSKSKLENWIREVRPKLQQHGIAVLDTHIQCGVPQEGAGGATMDEVSNKAGKPRREAGQTPNEGGDTEGLQVQVYTLEKNKVNGKPVYQAVAELMRHRGIVWVSTVRGVTGYGENRTLYQANWLGRRDDVPVMVTIVDQRDALSSCLPDLVKLVGDAGFVVSSPVSWHHP